MSEDLRRTPVLGIVLPATAWAAGNRALVPVLTVGVPLSLVLLFAAGTPVRTVVPLCASAPKRLGWASRVFVLGALGVLAGPAACVQRRVPLRPPGRLRGPRRPQAARPAPLMPHAP
ncbi:hypothetical protein [Streptomyces eurythermus]|uniref:hypothetical protein n=1 Tax=Streptomyces eurythermus TaxID=42237 RepID=UPI0036F9D8A8